MAPLRHKGEISAGAPRIMELQLGEGERFVNNRR
jgi:hypothetical protein